MNTMQQSRLRAQLKLLTNRLRILQDKKIALAKQNRRQLAQVLEAGKIESARIRVENIIQEDIYVELLETLEIYSELVTARLSTIHDGKIHDERLEEALHVLIYAGQYTEIKELHTIKPLIGALISKEFLAWATENSTDIPPKILSKIHIDIPKTELVELYLQEIAKAYSIAVPGIYEPPQPEVESESNTIERDHSHTVEGDNANVSSNANDMHTNSQIKPQSDDLWARFAALKK